MVLGLHKCMDLLHGGFKHFIFTPKIGEMLQFCLAQFFLKFCGDYLGTQDGKNMRQMHRNGTKWCMDECLSSHLMPYPISLFFFSGHGDSPSNPKSSTPDRSLPVWRHESDALKKLLPSWRVFWYTLIGLLVFNERMKIGTKKRK